MHLEKILVQRCQRLTGLLQEDIGLAFLEVANGSMRKTLSGNVCQGFFGAYSPAIALSSHNE
jgi:hypothetical protein